ncbi:MAG: hypothetical protein VB060_02010 [Oscillibacter sp.]|nr:hypothetical protein [Oscillibacter sp.]MEA4992597.1 hypothetical protein [Oscillibacter sp.]
MAAMEERIAEIEQRSKSNTHRIDKLEQDRDAINKLATAIAVMAEKQSSMSAQLGTVDQKVDCVSKKVDTLEKLPGKRWELIVEKALTLLVAAVVGYLLARMGMAA